MRKHASSCWVLSVFVFFFFCLLIRQTYSAEESHVVVDDLEGIRSMLASAASEPSSSLFSRIQGLLHGGSNNNQLYDLVINIESLQDVGTISKGWEVVFKEPKVLDAIAKSNDYITLSVLGLYNRGKTFVLNKLSGNNFPSGLLVHTKGLSVMLPRDKEGVMLIDTAGTQMPALESELEDRRATEAFLQDLVLHLADINIIVLNSLTLSDQVYIHNIWKRLNDHLLQQQGSAKDIARHLIVLHNFKELREVVDVHTMIERDIVRSAEAEVVELKDVSFWKHESGLKHIVIAAENSPAGLKYNEMSFRLLNSWLTAEVAAARRDRNRISVLDRMRRYTASVIQNYFKMDELPKVVLRKGPNEGSAPRLCLEPQSPLSYKPELIIYDGLFVSAPRLGFVPTVDIYLNPMRHETIVQLDLPGVKPGTNKLSCNDNALKLVCQDKGAEFLLEVMKVSLNRNPPFVRIAGTKERDHDVVNDNTILRTQRAFGSFGNFKNKKGVPHFDIPLDPNHIYGAVNIEWERGVLTVTMPHVNLDTASLYEPEMHS